MYGGEFGWGGTSATLFGIVGRAFRRRNTDADEIAGSAEFQEIKGLLNPLQFDSEMALRQNSISILIPMQPLFETPPSTPTEGTVNLTSFDQPFKHMQELDPSLGLRLYMTRVGPITKSYIESFTGAKSVVQASGSFGLLYGPDESPNLFVKDVLSTALCTVAEKKGIKTNVQHITL